VLLNTEADRTLSHSHIMHNYVLLGIMKNLSGR